MADPKLEHMFDAKLRADLTAPFTVGKTSNGMRTIFNSTGGTVVGVKDGLVSDFNGEVVTGADWVLAINGFNKLDVRLSVKDKKSGETLYISFKGFMKATEQVADFFAGRADKDLKWGQDGWAANIKMEASSEKLSWVEWNYWIGQGRLVALPGGKAEVQYRIYRVNVDTN